MYVCMYLSIYLSIYLYIYIYILYITYILYIIYKYIYIDTNKEIITTELTTLGLTLLLSSGKYEWCTVLNIPNIDGANVFELNNLIINAL